MKQLLAYIALVFILSTLHISAEGKKIIKWVDKNGVTHYGDHPPMPSKANTSSVLNKQGIILKRIEHKKTTSVESKPKALTDRARHDKALLASYYSVEEIEIARKRNIKIDTLTVVALEDKKSKINLQLQKNNNTLLELAKDNKPAPADTVKAIQRGAAAREKLVISIKKIKAAIEKINHRYEQDKLRYIELKKQKVQKVK